MLFFFFLKLHCTVFLTKRRRVWLLSHSIYSTKSFKFSHKKNKKNPKKPVAARNQFFPGHTDKWGETKFCLFFWPLGLFLPCWKNWSLAVWRSFSFSFLPHVIQFRGPVWIYCLSLWPGLSEQSAIWLSGQTLGGAGNKGRASGFMCAAIWDPFFFWDFWPAN